MSTRAWFQALFSFLFFLLKWRKPCLMIERELIERRLQTRRPSCR
jgi:hypothetical protein